MPRPVAQKLSEMSVSSQEEVLPFLQRELIPVLNAVREVANQLAETGWDRVRLSTQDASSAIARSIDFTAGESLRLSVQIQGTDVDDSFVLRELERTYTWDGDAFLVSNTWRDEGPFYVGADPNLSTADIDISTDDATGRLEVRVVGETDTDIRWSVFTQLQARNQAAT